MKKKDGVRQWSSTGSGGSRADRIGVRALLPALLLGVAGALIGCSSTPPAPIRFSGQPQAAPAFDQVAGGIYRGVLAADNASGTFEIRMQPSSVSSDETAAPPPGSAPSTAPLFQFSLSRASQEASGVQIPAARGGGPGSSTTNGTNTVVSYAGTIGTAPDQFNISLTLTLGQDGRVQNTSCTIDGAPAASISLKELSTRQVVTFEGTYSGTSSGTWNMIVAGQAAFAVYASYNGSDQGMVRGSRTGDILNLTGPRNLVEAAGNIISSTSIRGTWSEQIGEPGQGTLLGNRSRVR